MSSTAMQVYEIFISCLFVIALIVSVVNISENTNYWKGYYAKDNALVLDSLLSGPGESEYVYYLVKTGINLEFDFKKDRVVLAEDVEAKERSIKWFPFGTGDDIRVSEQKITTPTSFLYSKILEGDVFAVAINPEEEDLLTCKKVNIGKATDSLSVFVDYEDQPIPQIIEPLKARFRAESGEDTEPHEDFADIIIYIEFSEEGNNEFIIDYPESAMLREHDSLSCFMKNEIASRFPQKFDSINAHSIERGDYDFGRLNLGKIDTKIFLRIKIGTEKNWNENPDFNGNEVFMIRGIYESIEAWSSY